MLNLVQPLLKLIKNEDNTSFFAAKCHSIILGGALLLIAALFGSAVFFGVPINCQLSPDVPAGMSEQCLSSSLYILISGSVRYSISRYELAF